MNIKQRLILITLALSTCCVFGFLADLITSDVAWPTPMPTTFKTPAPTLAPWSEEEAEIICQEFVKRQLNFPLTAKFDWTPDTQDLGNGEYIVLGSVAAENAFGVPQELAYICQVKYVGGMWELVELEIF